MIPKLFKDNRRSGETALRRCQLVQLHLLYVIDKICKTNHINYCMAYGTLIGAMRHKGFIPWDDDLDVWMPKRDYKKFLKFAQRELPEDVLLHKPSMTPKVPIPFAKLRDRYSFMYESGEGMSTLDPNGIFIDIFPIEKAPRLPSGIIRFLIKCVSSPWNRKRWFMNRAGNGIWASLFNLPFAIICHVAYSVMKVVWSGLTLLLPGKKWLAQVEVGSTRLFREDLLFPFKPLDFEDGVFLAPSDPDACLQVSYGDWRQIPPEDERPRHATIIDPFHSVPNSYSMKYPGRA